MSDGASDGVVTTLSVTAVKGTRLRTVESVELGPSGAVGDRRFFVIDERGRMVNGKTAGELQRVVAEFESASRRLQLVFPGGRRVSDVVDGEGAEELDVRFYSRPRRVRLLEGPWGPALSELVGRPLRLVDGGPAVDRGVRGAVSLISCGSLGRLASEAGVEDLDARRFRMLVEIDGVSPHEEDRWVGQTVQIGPAVVRFEGHVGRCLITSRQPETGKIDLPTLDVLRSYRREVECTEPLPFGVYGRVLEGGRVSVGDPVSLVSNQ